MTKVSGGEIWNPRTLSSEAWQRAGVDPATLTSHIAGLPQVGGFKRCGGSDLPPTCQIDVWSQIYTIEDFHHMEGGVDFVEITIADRTGLRYQPSHDLIGIQCDIVFPADHGSYSIVAVKLDPQSGVDPCVRVMEAAEVLAPLLPR